MIAAAVPFCREDMIRQGTKLLGAAGEYAERAKAYFHAVMLSSHECPHCSGRLIMLSEGACECGACGHVLDPTLAFQSCTCGGKLRRSAHGYRCRRCGEPTRSRFVFRGVVFDKEYFRQKMAEHRKRKEELRDRVRALLAQTRSADIEHEIPNDGALADLEDSLLELLGPTHAVKPPPTSRFNLEHYKEHVLRAIQHGAATFESITPLHHEPTRLDRIWRFIALVFLMHAGRITAWQNGTTILVEPREAH